MKYRFSSNGNFSEWHLPFGKNYHPLKAKDNEVSDMLVPKSKPKIVTDFSALHLAAKFLLGFQRELNIRLYKKYDLSVGRG